MKKATIPKALRDAIREVAKDRCEYCLMPSNLASFRLQIDHIIPERQEGPTIFENLALACKPCNCKKGYNIVRYYYDSGKSVMLFNPRKQNWTDHFQLHESGIIEGLSDTGNATTELLDINLQAKIDFRKAMINNDLYRGFKS